MADEVGLLTGQKIPYNLEAELACLGAILLKNDLAETLFGIISPEDFYNGRNRVIAETILRIRTERANLPVDLITLTDYLKNENKLSQAGGIEYISQILDAVPTTANAERYAEIVRDKALQRKLSECGREIVALSGSADVTVAQALDSSQQLLFNLETKRNSDFEVMGDILRKTIDQVEENYRNKGRAVGIPTGFRDLDRIIGGFQESNLIIIGARPGIGKTSFALSIVENISIHREEKIPVGIFSLEMTRNELCLRVLCAESRVPSEKVLRNQLHESDWPRLIQGAEKMLDAPIYIDDSSGISLYELTAKARRMRQRYKVELVIVDYLQLMASSGSNQMQRQEFVASLSRGLKQLARDLKIPVIALTQLNRNLETRGAGEKEPKLADIRESGAIEQDADLVIFLHKPDGEEDEMKNHRDVIVAKNRHGQTSKFSLFFNAGLTRFENHSREPE
jgi:replicative DNA helicase